MEVSHVHPAKCRREANVLLIKLAVTITIRTIGGSILLLKLDIRTREIDHIANRQIDAWWEGQGHRFDALWEVKGQNLCPWPSHHASLWRLAIWPMHTIYTLSHLEGDHDATERAQGYAFGYTLQDASFMGQSHSFLNIWKHTHITITSVCLWNMRWCHGCSWWRQSINTCVLNLNKFLCSSRSIAVEQLNYFIFTIIWKTLTATIALTVICKMYSISFFILFGKCALKARPTHQVYDGINRIMYYWMEWNYSTMHLRYRYMYFPDLFNHLSWWLVVVGNY